MGNVLSIRTHDDQRRTAKLNTRMGNTSETNLTSDHADINCTRDPVPKGLTGHFPELGFDISSPREVILQEQRAREIEDHATKQT